MTSVVLPWLNALLYVIQVISNVFLARKVRPISDRYDTLLTPSASTFSIWGIIYLFCTCTVLMDLFNKPFISFFEQANDPNYLRICFMISCMMNTSWMYAFTKGFIHIGTLLIICLWLSLLNLYLYLVTLRSITNSSHWMSYLLSQMGILIYFSWVSIAMFISICMSVKYYRNDKTKKELTLKVYLIFLALFIMTSISGIVYAKDQVIGFVSIWALYGIVNKKFVVHATKDQYFLQVKIQSSARLGIQIISLMLLVFGLF
jgi:benzodiazapine receptor